MTIARKLQFDAKQPPWIHAVSRCVRRAYLCGEDFTGRSVDHRKAWIEDRLRLIAGSAAVDISGYAIMTNHLHVVLRMRPDLAETWPAVSVVERYLTIWPRERDETGQGVLPEFSEMEALARNTVQVAKWRERLGDLGWTMKALKEDISRRANREDHCSGAFWEGRYKSIPLLDQAALVACMAYVDLNPIRAKVAEKPEESKFTGVYERIRVRQALRRAGALRRRGDQVGAKKVLAKAGLGQVDEERCEADRASWLTPVACCLADGRPLDLDDYLTLVDQTGRLIRGDKRGSIPKTLAPILERLDLSLDRWMACMLGWRQFLGAAVGRIASRLVEAGRRGVQWVQNRCRLFDETAASAAEVV